MEKKYLSIIVFVIIIFELIVLIYVSPRKDIPRDYFTEYILSKICLNTKDLFEAPKRALVAKYILSDRCDERLIMYYADLVPKPNKEYIVCLGSLCPQVYDDYYLAEEVDGVSVFLPYGLKIEMIRDLFTSINLVKEYKSYNRVYKVCRRPQVTGGDRKLLDIIKEIGLLFQNTFWRK